MKEILEKYCTIKENFSNQFIPNDDVILYQYQQGIEFMYICGVIVELRLGISHLVYHNFKEANKLQMFFDSLS